MRKAWILLLALLIALLCAVGCAEETSDWSFDREYRVLTGYSGADANIVVPSRMGESSVEVVDTGVLAYGDMQSIDFEEGVSQLRGLVGSYSAKLQRIALPESLIVIGEGSFAGCESLSEVAIPANVRYIGANAFSYCARLASVTFEGVCPVFAPNAFCEGAESVIVNVPDDQLGAYTEALCALSGSFDVRPSGRNAVQTNPNGFAEADFEFDSATGTITAYHGSAAYLEIPETIGGAPVRAIGEGAFEWQYYLAWLKLPEGLERIGANAFARCVALVHVEFPSTLRAIGDQAFAGAYRDRRLELENVVSIGAGAFERAGIVGALALPETLESIGANAFDGCGDITELTIPASVQSIGSQAFRKNGRLEYVYIAGETLPEIAEDAFAECAALSKVDLNESAAMQQTEEMQSLLEGMGLSCRVQRHENSLATEPEDQLDTYANGLLTGYTGAQTHIRARTSYVDSSGQQVDVIGVADGALKDNQTVQYFAISHKQQQPFAIGAEAFRNSALQGVDLFDCVTTIGANAFAGCAQLEELTIPESVTEIGAGAFEGLTGLKRVTILCDASLLPEGAFAGCTALVEAEIQKGAIPARLFADSGLAQVTLGEGVTVIGEGAFENTAISEIALNASATAIGERAFANTQLARFVIPANADVAVSAFDGIAYIDLCLSADATDAQLAAWNERLGRPAYDTIVREGEESPFKRMALDANPDSDFEFDSATGRILAYAGSGETVIVPREIGGVTVTGVDSGAFDACRDAADNGANSVNLRALVLPETIESLPDALMADCRQLETFVCYAPVESTGANAFRGCRSLNSVIFANGVNAIESGAFEGAGPLGTLYFGDKLSRIASGAFKSCGIASFVVDAEEIEPGAFESCPNLKELHFTGRVKAFGENAIADCPELTSVCFENSDLSAVPEQGFLSGTAMRLTIHVPATADEESLDRAQNCVTPAETMPRVEVVVDFCARVLVTLPDVAALLALPGTVQPEETAAPEVITALTDADVDSLMGTWYATAITMNGQTVGFELLGGSIHIEVNPDGTATLFTGDNAEESKWTRESDAIVIGDMRLEKTTDGARLSQSGVEMTLARDELEKLAPTEIPTPEPTAEPTPEPTAVPDVPAPYIDYIEKKYVLTDADVNGYEMPAPAQGDYEYSLLLHADGTLELVLSGAAVPGLTWTAGATADGTAAFIIDYFGQTLEAVIAGTGLDMNYFDSMQMHFEPEK